MDKTVLSQANSEKNDFSDIGIEQLYTAHKGKYLSWAKSKFNLDHASLLDIYQDAIIIFFNHVKRNKLDEVQAPPEAYLTGIAKNLILKKIKKNKKTELVEKLDDKFLASVNMNIFDSSENEDYNLKLQHAFAELGDNCKEILTLFYYERYSLEFIQAQLDYNSADTVKSRKYQCLKKLRTIFKATK